MERIVFEATGPYHRAFEHAVAAAASLARCGALLTAQTRDPVSQTLDKMKQLHNARTALVKDRTTTATAKRRCGLPFFSD